MKTSTFKTNINSSAQKVWDIMTDKDSYEKWTGVAFPGSTFIGNWKQGEQIKFIGPDGSGTLVNFVELEPAKKVRAVHEAMLLQDGKEDRESDTAKGWIGTKEDYTLTEQDGSTLMLVEMSTTSEWSEMFEKSWPKMLEKLKELCEQKI